MLHFLGTLAALLLPATAFGHIHPLAQIVHPDGKDRLTVNFVRASLYRRLTTRLPPIPDPDHPGKTKPAEYKGSDFHSLLWERYDGRRWRTHARLTERQFRKAGGRWVMNAHGLDPIRGVAVIQVCHLEPATAGDLAPAILEEIRKTGKAPEDVRVSQVRYAWVAWDMRAHRRVALLQECDSPFDPYRG